MKKGITIMSMSIVILVTLILATTVVISASSIIESVNKTKFVAEVENIQDAIQNYKNTTGNYPLTKTLDIDITSITSEALTQFASEAKSTTTFQGYMIDFNAIGIKDKEFGNNKDGRNKDAYVFSKKTGRVYYVQGIKYKGMTYYTAAQEICGNEFNAEYNTTPIDIDGILIYPSETEMTANPVMLVVKVPNNIVSFSTAHYYFPGFITLDITIQPNEMGYTVYWVNSRLNKNKYDFTFSYMINGERKTYTYKVTNVDGTPPIINETNKRIITIEEEGITKRYLSGFSISDSESGIEIIKYELSQQSDLYFDDYGKVLNDNKIDITGATYCTIYARNKSGVSTILGIDVTPTE